MERVITIGTQSTRTMIRQQKSIGISMVGLVYEQSKDGAKRAADLALSHYQVQQVVHV